jgi:hypothetical protein
LTRPTGSRTLLACLLAAIALPTVAARDDEPLIVHDPAVARTVQIVRTAPPAQPTRSAPRDAHVAVAP